MAEYITTYTPSLLESLPRLDKRQTLGITEDSLPFGGIDIWNAYEFSWLNNKGKPEVALARFRVPAKSKMLVESKSLKLYLGSYSQTPFGHRSEVISTLESDLSLAAQSAVVVELMSPEHVMQDSIGVMPGNSMDGLDIEIDDYYWNPDHLDIASSTIVRESVYTHLFKSLCPLTGQPDFASIQIEYNGPTIDKAGLLKYLVSYRQHAEFAEQVIERIFMDISNRCKPERLSVQGQFTRRGGIDINPFRASQADRPTDLRVWRQ